MNPIRMNGFVPSVAGAGMRWMQRGLNAIASHLRQGMLVGMILLLSLAIAPTPAVALIRTLEEAPGQVVYQSRNTLEDQQGQRWQAIAFNRLRPDGSQHIYLRLVAFPGSVRIDRTQPLRLSTGLGNTLIAPEASAPIFTDADRPEPHIGQYDLQPIIEQVRAEVPLQLSLSLEEQADVRLSVPSPVIAEWDAIAHPDTIPQP